MSFTIEPPCTTAEAEYSSQGANFELGAVQKRANLVDLETCYNMSLTISKVGFGTTENGPSKISVTDIQIHRYTGNGIPAYQYKDRPSRYIPSQAKPLT